MKRNYEKKIIKLKRQYVNGKIDGKTLNREFAEIVKDMSEEFLGFLDLSNQTLPFVIKALQGISVVLTAAYEVQKDTEMEGIYNALCKLVRYASSDEAKDIAEIQMKEG